MDNKDKTQKTVNTNTPIGQDAAKYVLGQAQNLYQNGNQNALAPLSLASEQALNWTVDEAYKPIPGLGQAQNFTQGMIANNGMTGDLQGVAGDIRNGMSQVSGYLTPFANGSMQEDPRLAAMLDTNANRAANAAATRFGGGRYGSAAIGNGVGTAVTDANNATMLQSNENARSRQLQASQALGSLNLQGNGLLGQMYEGGLGRAAQATSMLPALNDLRYDGLQRMAGVGDYLNNRAQTEWDYPQTQLGQYGGLVQALGGMGGSATSVAPVQQASTAQRLIGGSLAGASLGSKVPFLGPTVGALGGGLLGMFG